MSLVSFGFKHGVPYDADLVFDVRFLPNPHFVEELRPLDGRDRRGARSSSFAHDGEPRAARAASRTSSASCCPLYQREGKAYLTVAIGCTGGRHRSVALVEALKRIPRPVSAWPIVSHRDLDRE